MNITTDYPGASPEDVELNITVKIEEAIKEIDGIDKYISSSLENRSSIVVFIDPDYDDKEKVKADIRRAVDSISDLPVEVEDKPFIDEEKIDNMPIYEVALSIKNDDKKLLNYHEKKLKKILLNLDCVSKVYESGIRDREYRILLNRNKMKIHAITFNDVIEAIKNNKIRMSGGSLESYTAEKGILTFSEFSKPEDIENIIIRASGLGSKKIQIKDVGRVIDDFAKINIINKYNGHTGVALWVAKKPKADVIRAVDKIKEVLDNYKKSEAVEGLNFFSTWDASIETKNRLFILYTNAIFGFILVLFVLFFFLDKKIAFWTSVGIPVSIAGTLILLPWLNITINSISILGLVVVLGMVVDDAIIISESIYRAKEEGMSPVEASIYGLKIVIKPVLATIITTIIAFLPLYFLPGIEGKFALEIPSIVIIMLTVSFFEATLMLPAHLAHSKENNNNKKRFIPPGQKLIDKLKEIYAKLLERALKHKYISLLSLIIFLVLGIIFTMYFTKFNLFPIDQSTQIWISGETKTGSNLEYTTEKTELLEEIIKNLPGNIVYSYKTNIGSHYSGADIGMMFASNFFYINLILIPANKRKMTAMDVKDYIIKKIEEKKIDVFQKLDYYIESGGPEVGKPLEIRIRGNDNKKREDIIKKITQDLKEYPIHEIDTDLKKGKKELRILPNYELIANAKLDVATIATTIRTAFDGYIVSYYQTPEEKIPFRVILDEKSKNFDNPLSGLYVKNPYGTIIPIKSLVYEKMDVSNQNIYHFNGERTNTITANVDLTKTTPKDIFSKLKSKYQNFEKENPGFKLILGGEAEKSNFMFYRLITLLLLAILAIYFILVIQFNSFIQPLMVILSIPFGLLGITIAFAVQKLDLSMMSMVGIIGFTGVVVNDSLIMVYFINDLKNKKNINFKNAIIEGAKQRLRPIMLTTLTTVAGLFPTAYGLIGRSDKYFFSFLGGFESFVSPMVMAMMWGLLVGTTATLIVIPVLYIINEDIHKFFRKLFKKEEENLTKNNIHNSLDLY